MRIVTLNIHGWRTADRQPNVERVIRSLGEAKADVIGLNAVFHPFPTPEGSALERLAKTLGMSLVFGACGERTIPDDPRPVSYGNALLSRFPLLSVRTGLYRPIADKQRRGFLFASLDTSIGPLRVVVTHLDHTAEDVRMAQWDDLIEQFRPDGIPEVMMGDFNCLHPKEYEARPEIYERLRAVPAAAHQANDPDGPRLYQRIEQEGFIDSIIQMGRTTNGSLIKGAGPTRVDFIWLQRSLSDRLIDSDVIIEQVGEEASDHRPVFVELRGDTCES